MVSNSRVTSMDTAARETHTARIDALVPSCGTERSATFEHQCTYHHVWWCFPSPPPPHTLTQHPSNKRICSRTLMDACAYTRSSGDGVQAGRSGAFVTMPRAICWRRATRLEPSASTTWQTGLHCLGCWSGTAQQFMQSRFRQQIAICLRLQVPTGMCVCGRQVNMLEQHDTTASVQPLCTLLTT